MIVGCSLLGGIQPYLWAYSRTTGRCALRPGAERLWEAWSWSTEVVVFFVVPVVILVVNVFVMRVVWRMSNDGPVRPTLSAADRASRASVGSASSSKNAATNAMLLTVSFYVIFTTLPATLVYVLANAFPEVRPAYRGACRAAPADATTADDRDATVAWERYVVYQTVKTVVNEICLSHYACNFFFYVVTGREFRLALRRLFRRREHAAGVGASQVVAACNRANAAAAAAAAENGSRMCSRTQRHHDVRASNDQRTPFVSI